MWRWVAGAAALILAAVSGWLLGGGHPPVTAIPLMPRAEATALAQHTDAPLPDALPEASDRTREQKRFDRYDKDRDQKVTREEYLASRHKAFAKLDRNGDGMLSFDEWAAKTTTKFVTADRDRSGSLSRAEFATTAVKRKPQRRRPCAPQPQSARAEEEG